MLKVTEPGSRQMPAAYLLGAGVIAAALFGAVPAILDTVEYVQYLDAPGNTFVPHWALVLLLLGVVQAAYGLYVIQLPDWTSVWVVTICLIAIAGLYALGLGVVLISSPNGWLVGPNGLQLADKLSGGKAALWCLCMISVSTLLAFFAGRLCASWRPADGAIRRASP